MVPKAVCQRLLVLDLSGHNTVFLDGVDRLMGALQELVDEGSGPSVVKSPQAPGPL